MTSITKKRFIELVKELQANTIAVVGDVMLDRYFWGTVSRVSPEAPVPVVDLHKETYHLGGGANAASNLNSLGATSLLCGQIGDDDSGIKFEKLAAETGMLIDGLYVDPHRPTTVKARVFGNNQQLVRMDTEIKDTIDNKGESYILNCLEEKEHITGVIFCDYNKGTLTDILIRETISKCLKYNVPMFVDPKFENFFEYTGVTLFKPNRKEAEQALNMRLDSEESVIKAGKLLLSKLKCENVLLTLGSDGMMLFEKNGSITAVPTNARHVSDVSGAGDTVIATFAAFYTAGATVKEAATIANVAAGIVCERPGIVSIEIEELSKAFL